MPQMKNLPPNLVRAGYGKITLSSFLDFLMTGALMLLLYFTLGTAIRNNGPYAQILAMEETYIDKTTLFDEEHKAYQFSDEGVTDPTQYAYRKYIGLIWHYFAEVIPGEEGFAANVAVKSTITDETIPAYSIEKPALDADYGQWIYQSYFGYVEGAETNYFVPSVENDFTSVPKAGVDEAEYHVALAEKMLIVRDSKASGYYFDTLYHFLGQSVLTGYESQLSQAAYLASLPCLLPPPIIFLFIIPMCIPNGRTLGRLITGLAVVGIDGLHAKRSSLIIRQVLVTTIWLCLALPSFALGLAVTALLFLADYISRGFSKTLRAFHDKLSGTVVVDAKKSLWFPNKAEMEEYIQANPNLPMVREIRKARGETLPPLPEEAPVVEVLDSSTFAPQSEEAGEANEPEQGGETPSEPESVEAAELEPEDEDGFVDDPK